MLLPLLAQLIVAQGASEAAVFHGRANQLEVRVPQVSADVVIDGVLDEPVWRSATILTGFSLYQPVDGRPSPDSTEVRLWYSATALHVGIRAFEPHGGVRATLAERDRVTSDDNIELHLDTFRDKRRAFVFVVNPLGVQADGMKTEGGGFIPGSNVMPGQNDLSPDFVWQSKGRVTEWGYEVEMSIPFRSLRYPDKGTQDWGIQVVRHVQHSGYEETWTPAKKGSASFIAQSGVIRGLSGMQHGQVIELNPEATSSTLGAAAAASGTSAPGWEYHSSQTLGGNVRWGLGSNFMLNGTVRPDFSQVEADAQQIAGDARFALFYAERRPFFVEGSEQFNVPNTLVYTRTIAQPDAAAKITGKLGATDVAFLAAADNPAASRLSLDAHPTIGILRLKRDFAQQSTMGLVVSDREEGGAFNRVVGADVRHVFKRLYFASLQAVTSATRYEGSETVTAPMWEAVVDRTGRYFGFHYSIRGVGENFAATNGFVPRTNYVEPSISNRFTWFGRQGALLERYNVFASMNGLWTYSNFFDAKSMLESELTMNNSFTVRGGWSIDMNPALRTFAFDPAEYGGLFVHDPVSSRPTDFVAFEPSDRITTAGVTFGLTTPQFRRFSASAGLTLANDIDFFETSRVRRVGGRANIDWRPTEKLRVGASYLSDRFSRRTTGDLMTQTRIPRMKVEYQLSRAIFVRFVGQYTAASEAPLIDPNTNSLIYRLDNGQYVTATRSGSSAAASNNLRVDWLFSYRPTPGTVFFAGYGSSLAEPEALRFNNLSRLNDGFFVKASYLFRM